MTFSKEGGTAFRSLWVFPGIESRLLKTVHWRGLLGSECKQSRKREQIKHNSIRQKTTSLKRFYLFLERGRGGRKGRKEVSV